jgi:hypothetical protein
MSSANATHRILLLNFTDAEAEVLRRSKFNVELGFLGNLSAPETKISYWLPRPLYEYNISVYNSDFHAEEMRKLFPESKDTALNSALEPFQGFRTDPLIRIAFTGRVQRIQNLLFAGLPFLTLSDAHEGVSLLEDAEGNHVFAIEELTLLISSFSKNVKAPVGQYVRLPKDIYPLHHIPVIANRNGDQIAVYGSLYQAEHPPYIVLPQLKNNAAALRELLELIARLSPKLFPDRETREWYSGEEFAFLEEKQIDQEIAARIEATVQFVEAKRSEKEQAAKTFSFIKEHARM